MDVKLLKMQAESVVEEFKQRFPGRNIVMLPAENPTEIICEIEPTEEHPDYSIALAVVDRSEPHHHEKSVETYLIEEGTLILHVEDEQIILKEGDTYVVNPTSVHWAEGNATHVRVESRPGWA